MQSNKKLVIDYYFHVTFSRDNLVKVRIFFRDPFYVKIERELRMTYISLIGKA